MRKDLITSLQAELVNLERKLLNLQKEYEKGSQRAERIRALLTQQARLRAIQEKKYEIQTQ